MDQKGVGSLKLPSEFIAKMERLLQNEASRFFSTYDEGKVNGLRFNPLKTDRETFLTLVPFALSPVPFCPTGFYYDGGEQPGKHPYHAAGLYYIQEPSAMFVAEVLAPNPGETVLDLCAAPGGKTTQLAAMMKNQGLIVANEIHPKRVKALSENIERFGITNALVTNETPEKLAKYFPGFFDKILVDAPCSGEGMFRKDEEAVRFWSQAHVEQCASKQRHILDCAYSMLKEGGVLVYSTCTFSPEENEQMIEAFLQTYDDLELLSIEKVHGIQPGRREWTNTGLEEIERTARLWPHCLKGEGHFVAKMKKTGSAPAWNGSYVKPNISKQMLRTYRQFEQEALQIELEKPMYAFQHHLFALPDHCPSFNGLKVVRAGLHVGEAKKQRFEPNHALALALKPQDVRCSLDLSSGSSECFKYLRGETIETGEDRGWLLVTVDGYPLGWGKEVKGIVKNFYPKGLRVHA
ncbi:RsmF rRNA methyltransferase first C-terminal domain-containing protein [Parageobacillus thermoglucosidasius]|uniref:SAM-dependent methyltransferase n=1 Tax=Parageobacillus thermoglucosidasius TaxID=1426 RepID=A0AAN0YQL5_PARTM|nr:RsmF rRNA methyltransferase first C-terminal domain-containing protein [Parageobacillus thermoglucosidasius]ALF10711.1 SAM-dependent methyltransferase [Parageobacillus thermoglucosidasius]ANZ30789.1 SAM-dependent methyltransferase [Parageobacillus thermoglucosidasius]APM81526.1 SAM-dependent methyltransferase [Parageobacillus thermoglucosidasius]KJX69360.1 SAM-dependent methyltransferase [Parageobacillus thermoglucosidasius]RDE22119.1 NOL1/NOP2/sun family putative RNA methylase [Parageobaci